MNRLAAAWRERGALRTIGGHRIFVVDVPPADPAALRSPLLVLHGFPTSSFDFHRVVDRLAATRRVVLFDLLGYGFSDKPDAPHRLDEQADLAVGLVASLGIEHLSLLTHDIGASVGGELLARQLEGSWGVTVDERFLANGSIYLDLAHLSAGQEFLLALPDRMLAPADAPAENAVTAALVGTFAGSARVGPEELEAEWQLIAHADGHRLLPRTIRYIEDRRRNEQRYTGAIEVHPAPLTVVWGREDPIARTAMVDRLHRARPDAVVHLLEGVGHYPMVEAPERFLEGLGRQGGLDVT